LPSAGLLGLLFQPGRTAAIATLENPTKNRGSRRQIRPRPV